MAGLEWIWQQHHAGGLADASAACYQLVHDGIAVCHVVHRIAMGNDCQIVQQSHFLQLGRVVQYNRGWW